MVSPHWDWPPLLQISPGRETLWHYLHPGCLSVAVSVCPSAEGEGCKICPSGWTLHGTKCYWAADETSSWSESQEDCVKRGAELLLLGDQDELVKGLMTAGMWDGSWGWWYLRRGEALPRNLGSATSPVPKPLQDLCSCQTVGDTRGAWAWEGSKWGQA
uniref:Killer cell lectin-like receptor subfamily B member 1C n=1 Tax=Columba livia TaxID=8932 RepID=R7VSW2_COLLI